ncbi:site-specific integrase [Hymenobacter aerilatus]|uniref:Site-specific integrase n=1 Tax=Hymenobacter aerilatus TaxID=2932251 RepID=A0A8T9SZ65_9BACT|nr:site-specific integrase [Hymenobacter aerilatus]UOR06224.1 site-specific integrase [Hymenobacter aerilatus]
MCIRFIFRKNARHPEREGAITCRITVDKTYKPFTTPVHCLRKEWDAKAQRVKGNSQRARLHNALLGDIESDINRIYYDMERAKEYITPERLLSAYQRGDQPRTTLLVAWEEFEQSRAPLIGVSLSKAAAESVHVCYEHLKAYLEANGLRGLLPEEFGAKHADRFQTWMLTKRKLSQNYTAKKIQNIKQVLRWCVRQEYAQLNPLDSYSLSFEAPAEPVFLTPVELGRIWSYPYAAEPLRKVADLFLFQCYTGLAYVDLTRFDRRRDVQPGPDGRPWLVMQRSKTRKKTGQAATVRLPQVALDILDRYGDTLPVPTNQVFNRYLKEIGALLGLGKTLTTHVGRKTAGMLLLQDGMSLTAVSKILGHASVTMTERHYVSITDDVVSKEYERVYGKTGTED